MPSVYNLKPKFQNLLRPLVGKLASWGVTANMVTLAAMLGSIAYGFWLGYLLSCRADSARDALILLPLFLFCRMALNAVDGMLAREHGQKSLLGAYLNEVGDVVSDFALYLPFMLLMPRFSMAWVTFIGLCLLTELVGVMGLTIGANRRYDGPFGKSDRATLFGILGICGWHMLRQPEGAASMATILLWVCLTGSALSFLTLFNRVANALKEVRHAD